MGLMDVLFGADGVGGQPGVVGNAVNAVGSAGADAAKTLAKLPLTLATLPTDFLKNPSVFFGDGPRGIDLAAVFDKDYRKFKEADIKAQDDARHLLRQAQGVNAAQAIIQDLFGPNSGMSPAEGAQQAIAMGVPESMARAAQQRDYADSRNAQIVRELLVPVLREVPPEILAATDFTPNQAVGSIIAANNADAQAARQAAQDARAMASDVREAVRFGERDTPEQKEQRRQQTLKDRAEARRLALAQQQATANASDAARDVNDQYKDRLKNAPDVPQAEIDAANNDWNPFNNYGATKSKTSLLAERAAARKQARAEAYKGIDAALPPTSRQNVVARKRLRKAVPAAVDAVTETPAVVEIAPEQRLQALNEVRSAVSRFKAQGKDPQTIAGLLRAAGVPDDIAAEGMQ